LSGTTYQLVTYDSLGRKSQVFNPTRCNPPGTNCGEATWGYVTYLYDALDRTKTVTSQDGGVSSFTFSGNSVTISDQAGKKRKSVSDGLGRLAKVFEDPDGLNYETDYQYDALDNLLRVDQKGSAPGDSTQWRTRQFSYDSLSRLLTASNPESGTIHYSYDPNGNLATRTDARNITINYSPSESPIDQLNRVTKQTYSDGITPAVNYQYDTAVGWTNPTVTQTNLVGRLSEISVGGLKPAAEVFGYDSMGRIAVNNQCTPSKCGNGSYVVDATYDFAGNLTSLTYPSSRVVTFAHNSANWLNQVQFTTYNGVAPFNGAFTYWQASDTNFHPTGVPKSVTLGNGVTEAASFNNRLQLQEQSVATSGQQTPLDLVYNYTP